MFTGEGKNQAHLWRVEAAADADLERVFVLPDAVLVIDENERYGLELF